MRERSQNVQRNARRSVGCRCLCPCSGSIFVPGADTKVNLLLNVHFLGAALECWLLLGIAEADALPGGEEGPGLGGCLGGRPGCTRSHGQSSG